MTFPDKIVLWGGTGDKDSLRWIWRSFYENARKLGIPAVLADDAPHSRALLTPGTTVFVADRWMRAIRPSVPGVRYVLHNVNGDDGLMDGLEERDFLRLQVWTSDAVGEDWGPFRRYERGGRILFQPWGSSLLPEEFLEPVYNPQSTEAVFVGAVWSGVTDDGVEQGNEQVVAELRDALATHGLALRHLTQVSEQEMVRALRSARIAPAFAGGWQCEHDYIPCRALKAPGYGVLSVCNVPAVAELFGGWAPTLGSVTEMLESVLFLRRAEYLELVREQQRVVSAFTYRENLDAITRAFSETS